MEKLQRNKAIIKARDDGHSFAEIAKVCGISTSRVRQIYNRHEQLKRCDTCKLYKNYDTSRKACRDRRSRAAQYDIKLRCM